MSSKALVVIDMQNDFIDGSLGSPYCEKIVDNVVNKIKNFKGRIFYTQDTHRDNYLETQEGKKLPVVHCQQETRGWLLNSKVQHALDEAIRFPSAIKKSTFGSRFLAELIANDAYTEVHICGIYTDICVLTNALLIKTFSPEAEIIVDADCCASSTMENHLMALLMMSNCQIKVENLSVLGV